MEKMILEMILQTHHNIMKALPYLKLDMEMIERELTDRIDGIGWGNIKSTKVFNNVVKSMIKSPPNKMTYMLMPDRLPTKIKSIYDECDALSEAKFLTMQITYMNGVGFVRKAISKHVDKSIDEGLIGLTKAFDKGRERGLEIQLYFMSEEQKTLMLADYMPSISRSLTMLYKKIDSDLKAYDKDIEEKIDKIIEDNVNEFVSKIQAEYQLVA